MRGMEKAISDRYQAGQLNDTTTKEVLVLGIGNYLMGDEGVGVHFIHDLMASNVHLPNVDILDGGVGGFSLMSYFDDYKHVIIVDATMDGNISGTVKLIKPKFASDFPKALSAHDFGLKDMIESMYILGNVPELYLFTISIPSIKPMCIELSQEVKASLPELINRVNILVEEISSLES